MEGIVSCQGFYVRKTVADLIVRAERLLPQGYSIKILERHRSIGEINSLIPILTDSELLKIKAGLKRMLE